MIKKLKLSALALLATAIAGTAQAVPTNLLQAVTIRFTIYSQQEPPPSTNRNLVNHTAFATKDLIALLSTNGYQSGDMLVRDTPIITNVVVDVTNLVPAGTIFVVITNTSTSLESVSNLLLVGTNFASITTSYTSSNYIGNTNVTFGSNDTIADIDGTNVTLGTNTVIIDSTGAPTNIIGTNTTTVTTTTLTNAVGNPVGTEYVFVSNTLTNVPTSTNALGTASWVIYNHRNKGTFTPISTNLYFDIHRDLIYDRTNVAYFHGENIKANGDIQSGTTDELRTLIFSNSVWNINLRGYAHGHLVPVSLGHTASAQVVYSQDYSWGGEGSGVTTNSTPIIMDGDVGEQFFNQ